MRIHQLILFVLLVIFISCSKTPLKQYKTENVIIVVVDGQRNSESWQDTSYQYMPNFSAEIEGSGAVFTQFYNNGPTYTTAGFSAITTGVYQNINNGGTELPLYPSIFQYFLKKDTLSNKNACIINSKDKLEVLGNCKNSMWNNQYLPFTDCGIDGIGSCYRDDSITLNRFLNVLSESNPKLALIGFREPDFTAHSGSWDGYIQAIKNTDKHIFNIWEFINNSPNYAGKTTIFITNDHGRHLDGVADGFRSHGDNCKGCKHVNLFAFGPDFKKGVFQNNRELIDISATISELLHLNSSYGNGEVMFELFEENN